MIQDLSLQVRNKLCIWYELLQRTNTEVSDHITGMFCTRRSTKPISLALIHWSIIKKQ